MLNIIIVTRKLNSKGRGGKGLRSPTSKGRGGKGGRGGEGGLGRRGKGDGKGGLGRGPDQVWEEIDAPASTPLSARKQPSRPPPQVLLLLLKM